MNRGVEFERQLRASVPPWASVIDIPSPTPPPRELWSLKDSEGRKARLEDMIMEVAACYSHLDSALFRLRTAAVSTAAVSRALNVPLTIEDELREVIWRHRDCDQVFRPISENAEKIKVALGRMRGIHKPPFDFLIQAPGPSPYCLSVAVECKSAGGDSWLRFETVKPHQRAGLRVAAAGGAQAGVAVEFKGGEAYFLPIAAFLAAENEAREEKRMSLTPHLAKEHGLKISLDLKRGRTHRYYQVGALLLELGAKPAGPMRMLLDEEVRS